MIVGERALPQCHAALRSTPGTDTSDVGGFPGHPQFRATLVADAAGPRFERARLGTTPPPLDRPGIKFSHAAHLVPGGFPALGYKPLACADCHTPEPAGQGFLPVTYNKQCQRCHALDFERQDLPWPNARVPHGDDIGAAACGISPARRCKAASPGRRGRKPEPPRSPGGAGRPTPVAPARNVPRPSRRRPAMPRPGSPRRPRPRCAPSSSTTSAAVAAPRHRARKRLRPLARPAGRGGPARPGPRKNHRPGDPAHPVSAARPLRSWKARRGRLRGVPRRPKSRNQRHRDDPRSGELPRLPRRRTRGVARRVDVPHLPPLPPARTRPHAPHRHGRKMIRKIMLYHWLALIRSEPVEAGLKISMLALDRAVAQRRLACGALPLVLRGPAGESRTGDDGPAPSGAV